MIESSLVFQCSEFCSVFLYPYLLDISARIIIIGMITNKIQPRKGDTGMQLRRGSKQKTAVRNTAIHLSNHPTALQIFYKVKQEIPSISFSTVYRNLGILLEEGELISITSAGSEVHYDHNLSNHCHIQCRLCGKVRDVNVAVTDYETILPSDASGFTVDGVCVTFTGMCEDCNKKMSKKMSK